MGCIWQQRTQLHLKEKSWAQTYQAAHEFVFRCAQSHLLHGLGGITWNVDELESNFLAVRTAQQTLHDQAACSYAAFGPDRVCNESLFCVDSIIISRCIFRSESAYLDRTNS